MIEEQLVEPDARGVVLEYEQQRADLVEAIRLIQRKRGMASFVYRPGFLVPFGLLGVAELALGLSGGRGNPGLGAAFVVYAVLMPLVPRLHARAALKANQHQGALRVTVDDEGVRMAGAHAESHAAWGSYGSYAEGKRVFILRSPAKGARFAAVLVKRGAKDPADLDRLRALLDRHLTRV